MAKKQPKKSKKQKPAPKPKRQPKEHPEAPETPAASTEPSETEGTAGVRKPPPKRTGRRGVGPAPDPEHPGELLQPPEGAKKPRQARLPQMEDPQIEELESAAEEYASIRDQRMELTKEEVPLKAKLLALMKANNKTTYKHDGFDIAVIVESEKVRVRIKKEEE